MKKLFFILSVIFFVSCAVEDQPYHEVRVDPVTGQQVVYVHDGYGNNYFLDYLIFQQMFNSGGYGACNHYYVTNRVYVDRNYSRYSSYRSSSRYYGTRRDNNYRPSSPARSSTTSSSKSTRSSSPARSSSSSSGSSYRSSSPSRSSSSSHSSSSFRSSSPSRSGRR